MSDDTKKVEADLAKLAEIVRERQKQLRPLKRAHLTLVRNIAREGWAEQHKQTDQSGSQDSQSKKQDHDEGHSH